MSTGNNGDLVQDLVEGRLSRREFIARALALGLSFSAISAILAACGKGGSTGAIPTAAQGSGSAGTAAATAGAGAATAAVAPEGEILIWDRAGDLYQVMDAAIPAFNKKYPKIKVKHQPVETTKVSRTLISGVGVPDGAFIEDENLGTIAPQLYDITDWIQPYVKDLVGYKVRVNTHDGRIKGIPYDVDPGLLYYRADILDQYGVKIDDIKTYDDLIAAAKQLRTKNPSLKPIRIENDPALIVLWVAMFANQQGTSYIDAEGNLKIDSEPFLNIMRFLKNTLDAGVASRVNLFTPGDVAAADRGIQVFAPYAIWYNYGIGNLFKTSKGKWRATRLPAWQAGGTQAASMGGSSFVIPQKAKSPQLAWLYYQYMMLSPEGIKAAFGPNKIYAQGIDTLLPSYKPAYDTKLMGDPKGLGGQNLWELATSVAADIPENYYFPKWYSQMGGIFGANVQRLYDGKLSPEDVLKNSAADIKSKLMR
jgi:lactose/L-arabinose transport system substrate-binding protein